MVTCKIQLRQMCRVILNESLIEWTRERHEKKKKLIEWAVDEVDLN